MTISWTNSLNKTVSVTGAAAQQLSALLTANGFTGSLIGTELDLAAPSGQSLFIGDSTVTDSGATKGREIQSGDSRTWRSTGMMGDVIDPSQLYLYLATTDDVGITFKAL